MSNIETTNASKVKFRFKLVKAVSPELLPKFEEITNSFIEESPASAIKFLWKLTYAPEETIESIGFTSLPFSLSEEDDEKPYLSAGTITLFRNELRYQYTIRHNDFLKIPSMSEDCKKIYNRLEGIADSIVAYVLYEHCFSLIYFGREKVTRCLRLLKSEYPNYIHGGIRILRFNPEQANYLRSFLKEILDLLETLQKEYTKKYLALEELPSFSDYGNPPITNKLDFETHQPLDIGITEKSAPSEEQLGVHDKY